MGVNGLEVFALSGRSGFDADVAPQHGGRLSEDGTQIRYASATRLLQGMADIGHGWVVTAPDGSEHFSQDTINHRGISFVADNDDFGATVHDTGVGLGLNMLSQLAVFTEQPYRLVRAIKFNLVCQGKKRVLILPSRPKASGPSSDLPASFVGL